MESTKHLEGQLALTGLFGLLYSEERKLEMKNFYLIILCFAVFIFFPISASALPTVQDGYTIEIYATGTNTPGNMALDSSGNLFVLDGANGYVNKVTPDGQVSVFASGILDADGLTIDKEDNLFVSGDNAITKITSSGAKSIVATGYFSNLNGIAIDDLNNLFVADLGQGIIFKVTQNGDVDTYSNNVQRPSDVVFDYNGNLYVSDVGLVSILRVYPNGDVTTYYNEVGVPRFHPSGDMYLSVIQLLILSVKYGGLHPKVTNQYLQLALIIANGLLFDSIRKSIMYQIKMLMLYI